MMQQSVLLDRLEFLEEKNRQYQKIIDDLASCENMQTSMHLSRPQAVIYNALTKYGSVSIDAACELVHTQSDGYAHPSNVRFIIRKLRRKLPPWQEIETIWGTGWVLHDKSGARSGHTLCSSMGA